MTNGEAIDLLDNLIGMVEDNRNFNYDTALKMAIKALEQEPTTKNDLGVDCISRAEAIKCLECDFDITGKENMKTVVNYINSAHNKIVNLPRVKQEPFLTKIRAEIDKVYEELDGYDPDSLGIFLSRIDDIFDKYKAEK